MAATLADILIDRLIDWGVDTVFGLPGDGINGIMEALRTRQEKVRFVQVRHEEAAAFAACGYAKTTGRLGVCLATSGPGGLHLLAGLYDAKADGQPVLAITGHTYHDLIGTQYQQDVNLDRVFADVAAFSERVSGPAHVVNVLDQAVRIALGRRTVAHLTIPKDIQSQPATAKERSPANPKGHSGDEAAYARPVPPPALLQQAADLINAGKKVAILAGRGALGAADELAALAERVGGPVVMALLGKAAVPDASQLTTGGIGLLGTAPSYAAMKGCDTLVVVGSNFPYLEFYPDPGKAKHVQIDTDPTHVGLRCPVDVGLVGDCKTVLAALLPLVEAKADRSFLEAAQKGMGEWRAQLEASGTQPGKPLKPQVVAHRLNDHLADDAIVIADCGTVTTWAARYVRIRGTMQFTSSGLLASMANGVPYAVGAAVAHPGRQVVVLAGDGGLSMLLGELATLAKYNLPVKVIVFRNDSLGMIKWEQMGMEANPEFGCDLHPIDFAAVARGCGLGGFSADDPDSLGTALSAAFAHPGPAVVDAHIDNNEPVLPGHVSIQQAGNFAKALLRGQKDGWDIIKHVVAQKVREVI